MSWMILSEDALQIVRNIEYVRWKKIYFYLFYSLAKKQLVDVTNTEIHPQKCLKWNIYDVMSEFMSLGAKSVRFYLCEI